MLPGGQFVLQGHEKYIVGGKKNPARGGGEGTKG